MSRQHPLTPTNISRDELIPDEFNPAHDPRYWCLPPRRDHEALAQEGGRYPMYLVTQGRMCGIWKSWLITKAMVDGYPSGAQRGHKSVEACVEEWQLGCSLGLHPHPVDPAIITPLSGRTGAASPPATPPRSPSPVSSPPASPSSPCGAAYAAPDSVLKAFSPARERAKPVSPGLQEKLLKYCLPGGLEAHAPAAVEKCSASVSTESSLTASSSTSEPEAKGARYYAIWGGRIVYSNGRQAKRGFLAANGAGQRPQLLSTGNYDEALAFSEEELGRHLTTAQLSEPSNLPKHCSKKKEKRKVAKQSWTVASKLAFFESKKEEWVKSGQGKRVAGSFYTEMGELRMLQYRDEDNEGRKILDSADH
ncbi:hypothetical protein C8R43DRAFT_1120876 [Mycena crocata]|nr:hypothetical protein C8R43DRAFT_1120876 [Mycena crocata]